MDLNLLYKKESDLEKKINKNDNKKMTDKDKFLKNFNREIALTLKDRGINFNQKQTHR